jgi:hypothetical protein
MLQIITSILEEPAISIFTLVHPALLTSNVCVLYGFTNLDTHFSGTQAATTAVQPDADAIPVGSIQGRYVGPGNLGQKSS